ncbi:MAG: ferredoxin oxidoreductase [Epsilonproteobacteria bacterium]|nr:ferredoxin oxidoreductase [Campylobacterota bacterium]
MRYQIVVAGYGGQGVVFLVKVLSICAAKRGVKFLGTENHGMSQRGGSVSSHIKIGDFYNPLIDYGQADLLIGLDEDEAKLNLPYLKEDGTVVVNAKEFDVNVKKKVAIPAYELAQKGEFDQKGLNVFMLGVTLGSVDDFPFSEDEVKEAIKEVNPKFAEKNFEILQKGIRSVK